MNFARIVNTIAWALMTIGCVLAAIHDFTWFYVLMGIGCAGVTTLGILEYRWSKQYGD